MGAACSSLCGGGSAHHSAGISLSTRSTHNANATQTNGSSGAKAKYGVAGGDDVEFASLLRMDTRSKTSPFCTPANAQPNFTELKEAAKAHGGPS